MKRIIFVIFVISFALTSIAQSAKYFEHILGVQNVDENTLKVLQLPSGSYITLGCRNNDADFILTDVYGNSIVDTIYSDTVALLCEDAVIANDGNIVIAGWHGNGYNPTRKMWVLKTDTDRKSVV